MLRDATITIRRLRPEDQQVWLNLRHQLWPDSENKDALAWTTRDDAATMLAESAEDGVIGFVEVGVRPYADGCESSPVAFLEGWYVEEFHRGNHVGRRLVQAAAEWARQQGLYELASDSLLENSAAYAAHIRVGFEEIERSVKYRMSLEPTATAK